MTEYLDSTFDLDDPATVSAWDELSLWGSYAGALLLRHVPLARGMRVLDVGCGAGFPTLELAGRLGATSHVTGIDVWDAALERARAKAQAYGLTNVDLRHADAAALPFEDASFDLVVSNLGLNNFDDAAAAVRECARVLVPGGRIAITTNLQGHMRELYEAYDRVLAEMGDDVARERLAAHVAHRATVADVRALFEGAGLDTTAVHEETVVLRYADGSALLRHYFIRLGFLGAWKDVVDADRRVVTFERLEAALNAIAAREGEVRLTVPLAYVEARCLRTAN
jgi:ubiquinone/menaquinone biosynthesis C-methylase UbiE